MESTLGRGVSVILEPTGTNVIGAFGKTDLYLRGHKDDKDFSDYNGLRDALALALALALKLGLALGPAPDLLAARTRTPV